MSESILQPRAPALPPGPQRGRGAVRGGGEGGEAGRDRGQGGEGALGPQGGSTGQNSDPLTYHH